MESAEKLGSLSIPELVESFEKDIRFGGHSIRAEASRSLAGIELQKRADTQGSIVVPTLALRFAEMNRRRESLDDAEKGVHDALEMLLTWIQRE